jgi:crotonobetainyl-CoA:carnitine CoA-transferase CaiB-like acyl-CoA transferase
MGCAKTGPLVGIKVLEAAEFVSGPVAAEILADLGADVVKVERPGRGDSLRGYGLRHEGLSAMWLNINRSKRSIQLDLKSAEGRDALLRLAGHADVFIHNWRPGVAETLGLDDDVLESANPRLVRASISGFGPSGPRRSEPVFDSVVQAVSGISATQGRGGRPETLATVLIDKVAGHVLTQSILAGLLDRTRTGVGSRIEVSMLDAAAYFNFADMFQDATFVDDERRITDTLSPIAATADGYVVAAPMSGRDLERMGQAFGHPEWREQLKSVSAGEMGRAMARLVESATKEMSTADALAILKGADIACAPVLTREQHLVDEQVLHNDIYTVHDHARLGAVRTVRYPAYFDGRRQEGPLVGASAGEHDNKVLEAWA